MADEQPEFTTSSEHVVVLELFCGTAGLSASFKRLGLDVVSVDKTKPKAPKALVTKIDLTLVSNQLLVLSWIRNPRVKAVFMAPPCGTASAARNIQSKNDPLLPQPMRTKDFPDGLPDLKNLDFLRVQQSNVLYDFSATVFYLCCELGKLCMCENPRDSLYWDTTPWLERQHQTTDCAQCHQACAYGSSRPKWTKLLANFPEVQHIDAVCDGKHKHEPWGFQVNNGKRIYATTLEVHYPLALCDKIAATFMLALQKRGMVPHVQIPVNLAARTLAQHQPATNKVAPLIPEFKSKCVALYQDKFCIWPAQCEFLKCSKVLQNVSVGVRVCSPCTTTSRTNVCCGISM